MQYWGPSSKVTGKITGFDTKAIDQPIGRLLEPKDIIIFETLLWPYSNLYGYTNMDEKDFRSQLSQIRPWLQEPLQFEKMLYAHLSHDWRSIEEFTQYNRLHHFLSRLWTILDKRGTYEYMTPPLELG